MKETNQKESANLSSFRQNYRWEPYASVVILTIVLIYALWPILSAPTNQFPNTVDGMGHLTKIKYIADCLRDFHWPSWFPYWYNGSSVMQYYPPLSYLLMAPIQMIFDNIMITFKVFCFLSLYIGALGVWYTCYRFVGPLVGIWAGALYCVDPFLLRSLILSGVIAQGPIFALSPWLLFFTLLYMEKRTPVRWVTVCILVSLMILSHPMHAFMVAIVLMPLVLVLLATKRIKGRDFLNWGLAIGLGGGITSFWWICGVTTLETPGIPYLLHEAVVIWTANMDWYNPVFRHSGRLYFSMAMLLVAVLSILGFRKSESKQIKQSKDVGEGKIDVDAVLIAVFTAFIFSIMLSFGYHIPLFNYIPMSENLVPGRILSFSSALAAILCAIFIHKIILIGNFGYRRIIALLIIISSSALILVDVNPRVIGMTTSSFSELQRDLNLIPTQDNAYENGRFTWVCPVNSDVTYFPMLKKLNMGDGWNIEGTPHNRAIWQHNIAIPFHCSDYVVRNLLEWNTRSAFISNDYNEVQNGLIKSGFQVIGKDSGKTVLFNPAPSSYFMRQEKDSISIGLAALGLVMNYPWLIQGQSASLEDYSLEYLHRFKLIYLIEPDVKDFKRFQHMVIELAEAGKTVIVSMGRSKTWPLGDIIPYWENIAPGAVLVPTPGSPFVRNVPLEPDPYGQVPAMGNLDGVWMEMQVDKKRVPVIGYKNMGGNPVYFVGISMGQQLNSIHSAEIKALLEQLIDIGHPNKNFVPVAFPVSDAQWGHDGFSFNYKSEEPVSMLVSVTYTPRWKGKVDGSPLKVQQMENLILLDLPAGEHQVSMRYGKTWVGWLGIALSIFSLLFVMFIYRRFEYLNRFFAFTRLQIRRVVEGLGA